MLGGNAIAYENNLLLAAVLCLLLVVLFVLLLHIYARWLLAEGHLCRTSIAGVFGRTPHLRRSHSTSTTTYTYDITSISSCSYQTKGLDSKVIELIPKFVYGSLESCFGERFKEVVLECAICLSVFEEGEVGRSLPRCSHAFHVECIDMWLFSHSTCPICRAQVVTEVEVSQRVESTLSGGDDGILQNPAVQERRLLGDNSDMNQTAESSSADQLVVEIIETNGESEDENGETSERPMLDCSLARLLSRNRSDKRFHPSSVAIVQVV